MKKLLLVLPLTFITTTAFSIGFDANPYKYKVQDAIAKQKKSAKREIASTPVGFRALEKGDLIDICSKSCGEEYSNKVEVRDFYQLRGNKKAADRQGLTCFKKISWASEGTPCHKRTAHKGIHKDGLAPNKTEVHRGSWSDKKGGAWCIAYNEEGFTGMKEGIEKGSYKAGQVACVSGVKLNSYK